MGRIGGVKVEVVQLWRSSRSLPSRKSLSGREKWGAGGWMNVMLDHEVSSF